MRHLSNICGVITGLAGIVIGIALYKHVPSIIAAIIIGLNLLFIFINLRKFVKITITKSHRENSS